MSVLTQKKCLEGLRPGSVAYIVGHARWRKSRGKRPSLSFKGEFNPEVALRVASEEFNKLIDLASYWLGKARGYEPAHYHLMFFKDCVSKAGLPLSKLKTSEVELKKLKSKCHEISAKFWLSVAKGDNPALYQLKGFRDNFSKSDKALNHFGTSEEELRELERKIITKK